MSRELLCAFFSRDMTDPFASVGYHRTGALNVVDLANVDTISFIATEDLGKMLSERNV